MKILCLGAGGIGVSALVRYFLFLGYEVFGNDAQKTSLTFKLQKEGMKWVSFGEEFDFDMVVYSEAVPSENEFRKYAQEKNIPQKSYFEMIGEISQEYFTVAVAGTHGKSTVTSMIGRALLKMGLSPLVIVGTQVSEFGGKNISFPKISQEKKIFIVEACEYRENFRFLSPDITVITNEEFDHPDSYKTKEEYHNAFFRLKNRTKKQVISETEVPSYEFSLEVPGKHYQYDANIAYKVLESLLPEKTHEQRMDALNGFSGTERRFEITKTSQGKICITDYAHHPTEIRVNLEALAEKFPKKKIGIFFEPHQYSRTFFLFDDFVKVFSQYLTPEMTLCILDIYPARDSEEDKKKVNAQKLVDAIAKENVYYGGSFADASFFLEKQKENFDIIVLFGAGNIFLLRENL
jgi:UDP-N-acetylmuramate--alanine ligase